MSGILELNTLLAEMRPKLLSPEYVFCTCPTMDAKAITELKPVGTFWEDEGITLILEKTTAEGAKFTFNGVFRMISLEVHSSLEAVGLTASISTALASQGISANIVAAYHHDHVFVPSDQADLAIRTLSSIKAN